jgi:hypothetical protein
MTDQMQLKLAAAAVFVGALLLVFFDRSVGAWAAEIAVVVWLVLAWVRARRAA